jgi:ribonuclease T2
LSGARSVARPVMLAAALCIAWCLSPPALAAPRFDFYLLALTLEPGFCDDVQHARLGQCRRLRAADVARTPLVLHGLWPENLRPGTWPRDCNGAQFALQPQTRERLRRWMPGVQEGLERHEWRTHGRCSGLDPERYFDAAIRATESANAALGDALRRNAGRSVAVATLRAAADAAVPGYGRSVIFVCKNPRSQAAASQRRALLVEARVCIDNDGAGGAPGTLLRCADVQRRDQGCGSEVFIDDV